MTTIKKLIWEYVDSRRIMGSLGTWKYLVDSENNGYFTAVNTKNYSYPKSIVDIGISTQERAKEICQEDFERGVNLMLSKYLEDSL